MAEYISREAAIEALCKAHSPYPRRREISVRAIQDISPSDVRPVKRGHWTRVDYEPCGHDYICSECGCKSDGAWNFCHDCGADMREVKVDG